jgi:hypothetical protein
MRVKNLNVGIGTTSPVSTLDVQSTSTTMLTVSGAATGYVNAGIRFVTTNGTNARGSGTFMYDQGSGTEWFSGRPYSTSDSYIIGRKTSATTDGSTAQNANALMTVSSSGNVGIGVIDPAMLLEIQKTGATVAQMGISQTGTGTAGLYFDASDGDFSGSDYAWIEQNNDLSLEITTGSLSNAPIYLKPDDATAMTLLASGNVGIGTTSPSTKLNVNGTLGITSPDGSYIGGAAHSSVMLNISGTSARGLAVNLNTTLTPPVANNSFGVQLAPIITKAASGVHSWFSTLDINAPTIAGSGATVTTASTLRIVGAPTGATNNYALLVYTGESRFGGIAVFNANVTPGSDNTVDFGSASAHWDCLYYDATALGTCASDSRLKSNITDLSLGNDLLSQVSGLRARTFTYNSDPAQTVNYGFVAQEVLEVAPEMVATGPDGFYEVKYGYLPYLMLGAVQQLDARTKFIQSATTSPVMTIDSAGNVGLGTTNPSATLDVSGAVNAYGFTVPITNDIAGTMPIGTLSADGNGVDLFKLATYNLSGVRTLTTQVDINAVEIASVNLKTDANIVTIADLQDSVDAELTVVSNNLNALVAKDVAHDTLLATHTAQFVTDESRLTTLESLTDQLQLDMNTQTSRTTLLETQMQALVDFYTTFSLGNFIEKDTLGNVDLLGGKLKATILETGALTIEVVDAEAPTIGTAEILPVAVDADSDGLDDVTGDPMTDPDVVARDGMSIIVNTKAMTDMSRIFATPNTPDPVVWSIADRQNGLSFTLKLLTPVTEKVRFDWWIAEEK